MNKVNKAAVIDWLDELVVRQGGNQTIGQPLFRKTKQNVHALLSAAFGTAIDAETMTRNPAKGVAEADLNPREAGYDRKPWIHEIRHALTAHLLAPA